MLVGARRAATTRVRALDPSRGARCAPLRNRSASAALGASSGRGTGNMSGGDKHIVVPYTELEAGLAKLDALPAPRLVVFTADADAATGLPWCPDCVRALPAVRSAAAAAGAALLEVGVGQRADWKGNASHPCRTDARFKVGGVPTLVAWRGSGAGGASAKLGAELEAAPGPAEAAALVKKFITAQQ